MTDPSEARPWRCFVAVALPEGLRAELRDRVAVARAADELDADWRWTDPAGWHITLAFLGATPSEDVPALAARLDDRLSDVVGFTLTGGGLGAFPGRSQARVLWYAIQDQDHRLADVAATVRSATGTEDEARFRPHVTLARARNRRGAPSPNLPADTLPAGEIPVAAVSLMRSHLGRRPARYEALTTIPLRPASVGVPA